jgi:putative addiction module component (TIGR02574 family)
MVRPAFDVAQLTVAERLELLDALWDSLRSAPDAVPLSDAKHRLIEERRVEHQRDPRAAIPWEAVRAELLADQDTVDRARVEVTREPRKRG